jgi:hypothetical protein
MSFNLKRCNKCRLTYAERLTIILKIIREDPQPKYINVLYCSQMEMPNQKQVLTIKTSLNVNL